MENKYFVPELSDLFVGYECEVKKSKRSPWEKECIEDWFTDRDGYGAYEFEYNLKRGNLRTPYLTSEQIEDEGWILKINKTWDYEFEMHCHYNTYFMSFSPYQSEVERELLLIGHFLEDNFEYVYKGTCPSINEFRKIMSLLEFK